MTDPTTPVPTRPRPRLLMAHPGAELYGADRVFLASVAALTPAFDVTVALPAGGPLVTELEARGARVVRCRMPVLRRSSMRPAGAVRLLADAFLGLVPALLLLRRAGTVGVYVNTLTLPSWTLLARLAGRRSICHVHEAEQSAPRLLRQAMALCPALAHRVVANSRFTLDVLREVAPRAAGRAVVVHNAVSGPAHLAPAREALDGGVRLLFVGRLNPRKGPQVAVETLRELTRRGVAANLTVVGSVFQGYEWFEAELRDTVAAAGLTDRVDFLGFRADVWPHLAAADVALVPSVAEESFGNTVVEAVLAGRPVVVSDSSGLREAASGSATARTVEPGRVAAWADAVQALAADWPSVRAAAVEDAERARDRFDAGHYAAELLAVARSLRTGSPIPAEGQPAAGRGSRPDTG